jgi:hypothetical protein
MSSRREEKERRRQERLARERALEHAAARRRRRQKLGGGTLAVIAAVAVVVVAATGGGGGSKAGAKATDAKVVVAAANAAGCATHSYPNFGRNHVIGGNLHYKTNPPTSGDHNPTPASDGIYDPGGTPPVGKLVHALEHGRVELQYSRQLPTAERGQLITLMRQPGSTGRPAGYNTLLFENTTAMPYAVGAAAWQHLIGCRRFNPNALQALRVFRDAYVDHGPELIPTPE